MSQSRLIFYPAATVAEITPTDTTNSSREGYPLIDSALLASTLNHIGMIGEKAPGLDHYYPGEQFLSLITFLGCSPNIQLSPAEGDDYCRISIIENSDTIQCLGYTRSAKPKCPACTKRLSHWKDNDWQNGSALCHCDKCDTATPYARLNWKHECGFAHGGFVVSPIYPFEAVPGDQLLKKLEQATALKWDYCYADNNI